MLRVLHLNTQFASLGGIEAVLRFQHGHDGKHGMDSRFISFWEEPQPNFPRARFAAFERRLSVREARRRVADAWPGFNPEVVVHHTPWGQPYFADLDGIARRVLFLHSDTPGLAAKLNARVPLMDGIVAVSDVLMDRARTAAPDWPADRFLRIDYPIHPPPGLPTQQSPLSGRPIVLGYAGRLSTEQKRIERFLALSQKLASASFPWRIEFLGDGPQRTMLEQSLTDRTRHVFHGRKSGDEYWRIVSQWDAILFTSDFEGTPIALIEAMAAGVIPIHPAIGSGGDAYARAIDPLLAYRPADVDALAKAVGQLTGWDAPRWATARAQARALASRHDAGTYLDRVSAFLGSIRAGAPREKPPLRRWRFPLDRITFAQWEWIAKWRK
jgi:glycosyltransferase involved in cell wall biosynthesis